MKIEVRVITRSKKAGIRKKNDKYIVRVKAVPHKGKANKELMQLLSAYFNLPKSMIKIIKGFKQNNKIVRINHHTND